MGFDLNFFSWIAFAVIIGGIAFVGFRMLRQRMEQLRYDEQIAELEFQENLLAKMNIGALDDDNRFLQQETVATVTDSPASPEEIPTAPTTQHPAEHPAPDMYVASEDDAALPADVAAAGVMKQLGAGGLVTGIDGYIPLHGNSKGAVLLRLRTGKSALLVPQIESEAFLRHNARRADMIIMVGNDGKALVVSTLEHFLAENMGGF